MIRCRNCGKKILACIPACPHCGNAVTEKMIPKTIAELDVWVRDSGLPFAETFVGIGSNSDSPDVLGCYRDSDTGEYITYRNKRNGSRMVLYRGAFEEMAVLRVYTKLVQKQKSIEKQLS